MAAPRNLVNLQAVGKGYASRTVLADVTLGVSAGDRIGVVGRNGDGKSTLLRLIAGPRGARRRRGHARRAASTLALLGQGDDLDPARTIREELVGGRADHEWAGDARLPRACSTGCSAASTLRALPGTGSTRRSAPLSGGERRRIALARLLLDAPELLLLDEPTNHLDVEGVDWLARHLAARRGSLVVVTHDRWFLDAVCTATWEVADGARPPVRGRLRRLRPRPRRARPPGGRARRRAAGSCCARSSPGCGAGPPARTSKPKFRIEAANALIADEPEPRDRAELLRFATARLGDKRARRRATSRCAFGERPVLRARHLAPRPRRPRRAGRRQRLGQDDARQAARRASSSRTRARCERGATVRLAHLSQDTAEIPGHLRVLESLEEVRGARDAQRRRRDHRRRCCATASASAATAARTLVRDLSGGERRRLQLMRLLMDEPNVLLLDEPTNDLDIDTLTALEDLLDGWPGTLVVVSHDRYFVERVCDDVHALMGDGGIRHLPGGIEQYVELRRAAEPRPRARRPGRPRPRPPAPCCAPRARTSSASSARWSGSTRARPRCTRRWPRARPTTSPCGSSTARQAELAAEREDLEAAWLEASELLEA